MKTILLLGINNLVEEYAENILKIDMQNDIAYYPSITTHYTELGKYIDIAKAEKPLVITTQSKEMIDVFLESDLDLEIITVRKYNGQIKARKILTKEAALDMREKYDIELRA